jgi:probable HAF family extracellular repeat protein
MNARTPRRTAQAAITGALLCLAAQMQMQAQAQTAPPRATVQVLPTLGGNSSTARGVNDLGQVVGSSPDGTETRGFLWQAGSGMQALTPAGGFGDAMAINNAGQVVGRTAQGNRSVPYLWSPTTGLRVLPVPSGEPSGSANALNEAGVAAGYWSGPFVDRGMRWGNDGSLLELQPQNSQVTGINDAGQMVGGPSGGVGYLWQADGSVITLPSLDSTRPLAPRDINNLGVVVGTGFVDNTNRLAFMWQSTTGTRNLGHLGAGTSAALALNDFGQVVGSSRLAGGSADVAMLWREGAGMSNLSALAGPGLNLVEATGINRYAQVVGTASTAAGSRAYLMTLHPDWSGGDGAWDDTSGQRWNWAGTGTAAAKVGAMHDVVIDPGRSATVRGSADGQARSLRIGGTAGTVVTLDLNGGSTRLGDGDVATFTESAIGSGGVLRGSGRLETSDDLRVLAGGRIEVGAGEQQQLAVAYLDNQGTVRAQGTAFAPARLQVAGGAFYNQLRRSEPAERAHQRARGRRRPAAVQRRHGGGHLRRQQRHRQGHQQQPAGGVQRRARQLLRQPGAPRRVARVGRRRGQLLRAGGRHGRAHRRGRGALRRWLGAEQHARRAAGGPAHRACFRGGAEAGRRRARSP